VLKIKKITMARAFGMQVLERTNRNNGKDLKHVEVSIVAFRCRKYRNFKRKKDTRKIHLGSVSL